MTHPPSAIRNPQFSKTYDHAATERELYAWWEKNGWFKPSNDPNKPGHDPAKKPFVISIPPPNVTGELHLGHAMFVSVEDLMIRYHRMKGDPTLWVPGSDHAGIATQLQVEKMILREDEVTREELGREEFLRRTWAWKEKYGGIIYDQLRRLGASCDWDRVRFTLDEGLSVAVREAFVRLYDKGLIYRGPRLINWSPGLKTAVSDLEVEYSEEPGHLYYFKYRLADEDAFIPVATTRPETILGDTAVAVHPEDERYKRFIGREVLVPMLDRRIPVIADEAVDRAFGTGALKITPGHDFTDYEVGARHKLPIISMLDREAKVTAAGGPYRGLDRFEARTKLWADMQAAGLTLKVEPYLRNTPRSQRGGEIVEPMVSVQWFVRMEGLAAAGLDAVRDGRITIVPERFSKVYFNWLENIKDWTVSRQLWWGHRIPVWYVVGTDGLPTDEFFVARTESAAYNLARAKHGKSVELQQDPDVLDTWFSSGLWPFSTLGWPHDTPDLKYFYPTSVMETGYDILFFWVARMIMTGLEFTNEAPFHTVYLHGLVRDEHGHKMSKTTGNVVDPRWIIDGASGDTVRAAGSAVIANQFPDGIASMGTDALRFTLLTSGTPGNDLNLSLARVEANRNFANKIWNIARFIVGNLPEGFERLALEEREAKSEERNAAASANRQSPLAPRSSTLADRWILARLNNVIADATRFIDGYEFGQAGNQIYDFLWGDFADWYVEIAKLQLRDEATQATTRQLLVHVLDQTLRLLHPYVPYITEAVWQKLPRTAEEGPALIVAAWPRAGAVDNQALEQFEHLRALVRGIRNARTDKKIEPKKRLGAVVAAGERAAWLAEQRDVLAALAGLDAEKLTIAASADAPAQAVSVIEGGTQAFLLLEGVVDAVAERERLSKELVEVERVIAKSQGLLGSDFANRAPAAVVAKERARLAEAEAGRAKLAAQLESL
ncbi:MAG TPA: valine--tRNA ligase [Anaerolineales bacterium]|nr:valine--tRNA ligase [Anaerolineales bacterium]